MKAKQWLVAILMSIISVCAHAQIVLGTGGKGGTYVAMANDMVKVCGKEVTIAAHETAGSQANIQGIIDNAFTAGIVQFDVMRYYEEKDPAMARIKVLFPLHAEEIHLIGVNKIYKEGGFLGIGAKVIELQSIKDLAGKTVVAWGGSHLSAEYFQYKLQIPFTLVDLTAEKDPPAVAAKMLLDGRAHAIFAVGGAPIKWLRDEKVFGKQFKLLAIGNDVLDKVKGTYNGAKVNYPNLSNGQVSTLAVQALLVTRDFRTADRATALTRLRECVQGRIDDLRDLTGMHPKWQVTNPSEVFDRWANYQPPASVGATTSTTQSAIPLPGGKKK